MKLYPMDIQGRTVSSVSDTNTPRGSGDFSRSELLFCAEEGELHHANLHTHTFPPPLSEKLPLWPLRPSPKRSQNTKVTSAVDSGFSPDTPAKRGVSKDFFSRVNYGFLPSADKQRHCRTIHVKHQCIVATCISLLLGPAV